MKKYKTLFAVILIGVIYCWGSVAVASDSIENYGGDVIVDENNFPDEAFRTMVADASIDKNQDGKLNVAEREAVSNLSISNKGCLSLEGIQYFNKLGGLYCSNNQLTELDLSGVPELYSLYCDGNALKTLDISNNKSLMYLNCSDNQLSNLDISKNNFLDRVVCVNNNLTYLDASQCENLTGVDARFNYIQKPSACVAPNFMISPRKSYTFVVNKDNASIPIDLFGYNYFPMSGKKDVFLAAPDYKMTITSGIQYSEKDRTFIADNFSGNTQNASITLEPEKGKTRTVPITIKKVPFGDIELGDWYSEAVAYVNENKLMTGMDGTTFSPTENLARAQFATILYRMEGSSAVAYTNKFPDVPDNQFYSKPVIWANQQGIVSGYSNGYFGPGDNINREQIAVMMYRYAKGKGYDVSARNDLSGFPDKSSVNDFAIEAMQWAVGEKLITGTQGQLDPQGNAVRAQCATIIMRFMQKYSEK